MPEIIQPDEWITDPSDPTNLTRECFVVEGDTITYKGFCEDEEWTVPGFPIHIALRFAAWHASEQAKADLSKTPSEE